MLFSKRKRIIKKSVARTIKIFSNSTPKIYQHIFYGTFDLAPQNLVIWYLFETDADLKSAQKSGLCGELRKATLDNLRSLGYPQDALEMGKKLEHHEKFNIQCDAEKTEQQIKETLDNRTISISFTTKEDIDKKTNGDYHLYFQ